MPKAASVSDDDLESVHESDVGIMFDELEKVILASDLSPYFESAIESMIDGELTAEDLDEL